MRKPLKATLRDVFSDGEALLTRVTSAVFHRGEESDLYARMRSAVLDEPADIALPATWASGLPAHRTPVTAKSPPATSLDDTIGRGREWLMQHQDPRGFWLGELGADVTLVADYLCLMRFLGEQDAVKEKRLINRLLSQINDEGGWSIYPGGPSEINITLKAYFALKLAGFAADHPLLARAREIIFRLGGIPACNSFAKILFCVFGQWSWERVPGVVPELILFPNWCWFNIYQFSYWSRAILVPLALIYHYRPHIPVPAGMGLEEIRRDGPQDRPMRAADWSWQSFFLAADRVLRRYSARPIRALRDLAVRKSVAWLRQRCQGEGGLGAIYPSIMNAIMALVCHGDPADRRLIEIQREAMRGFEVTEGETVRLQPCLSPVWDTGWAVQAATAAGVPSDDPRLLTSARWLVDKEVTCRGDWGVEVHWKEPGGWFFQFENHFYPDTDDTACVGLALLGVAPDETQRRSPAIQRAVKWLMTMQSRNGGWGAFDRDNTKSVFEKVPFADHNALLDPPTVDVSARIVEFLATIGYDREHPAIARAIAFLEANQETDGSWYGRWGVNYIYGTWGVLRGLTTAGVPRTRASVQNGVAWLKSVQQPDGGWGESCRTYDDPSLKGKGPSCASQTAWGTMGVLSVCGPDDPAVRRGIAWLARHQTPEGTWDEANYTGGGFPKVFYLQYHLYRHYFPLLALSEFRRQGGHVD